MSASQFSRFWGLSTKTSLAFSNFDVVFVYSSLFLGLMFETVRNIDGVAFIFTNICDDLSFKTKRLSNIVFWFVYAVYSKNLHSGMACIAPSVKRFLPKTPVLSSSEAEGFVPWH